MADEIISYLDAKASGFKRYFTGKPCLNGHVAPRFVSNCACSECQYDRTRKWAAQNPELKNRFVKDWFDRHPNYRAAWVKNNPESIRKTKRKWYLKDPKKRVQAALNWALKHPEHRRTSVRNRTARRKAASGSHTADQILKMLRSQNWLCAACGISIKKKRHIDHIMPLLLGGSNDIGNLQGLCPACNCSKNAKDPFVWARELGIELKI